MGEKVERIRRRLQKYGLRDHLRGWWLARHFTRAGLVVVPEPGPAPRVKNLGGEIIVENCAFYPGVRLEVWQGARITIGNGTYLNRGTEIIAAREVTIGRDCKIAWDVVIMDTDQHPIGDRPLVTAPVIIGDRVWIGCRAIILKGVHIGHDAIVAAGAIVTHDVPPGGIVASPAARLIGQISLTEEQTANTPSLQFKPDHVNAG